MSELTVKEMAARERVDPKTVYRWIEKGAISVRRTPGGGIRIPVGGSGVVILSTNSDTDRHLSE